MAKMLTYEQISEYISSDDGNGCKLLTTGQGFEDEKIEQNKDNSHVNLKIQCKCRSIFYTDWNHFKSRNKKQCNKCSKTERHTYDIINKYINYKQNDDCELLTTKEEYNKEKINKNNRQIELRLKCKCGNEFYKNFHDFKVMNKKQCPECGHKLAGEDGRLNGDFVFKAFVDNNFIPLFNPSDYKGATKPLPYICKRHKDKGVQYKAYTCVNEGCPYCGSDKIKGENHPNWKGGISPISAYLRYYIKQWKKDSMRFCNYKCVLTQTRFDEIHHLYSFESIIKEIFNSDKIPINKVNEYTDEELKLIKEKSLRIHYKYGLGICLIKPLHVLYHKTYGEGNNTYNQFKEFITRLEAGEFNTYLQENNIELNINHEILEKLLNQNN